MIPGFVTRCAAGAALLLAWSSSAFATRVLHAAGGGAVRALVIGINKYPNLDKSAELTGAKADADDIAGALNAAGVSDVRELPDGEATREHIVNEMNRLVAESKKGDLVIITYSGHGMRVHGYKRWDGKNRNPFHSQMALTKFSVTDADNGHEVIVDAEMRAWYARLDAKGVDMLVVMDTCFGGHMREIVSGGNIATRELNTPVDDKIHDSFVPIPMNEAEAGANANDMLHLTFFAGATENSTVPEMNKIDPAHPTQVRGALSYFVARIIDGTVPEADKNPGHTGTNTRGELFRFLSPSVRHVTEARQFIDYGPRTDKNDAQNQAVFIITDDGKQPVKKSGDVARNTPDNPGNQPNTVNPPDTGNRNTVNPHETAGTVPADAIRVAIRNGSTELFGEIVQGRIPFVHSDASDADVIWDVAKRAAVSPGDLIMEQIDGSVLGRIIDRTWAVREIQKLAVGRILEVQWGDDGRSFALGEHPTLVAGGIRDSYLTVVNVAADGTIQFLFPVYNNQDPHMSEDPWKYTLNVDYPFGTDYTVVIATSASAKDGLVKWLNDHQGKRDAVDLVTVLRDKMKADGKARIGAAGLFTHAAEQH